MSTAPIEDTKSQDETKEALDHNNALGFSNTTPAVPDRWKFLDAQETDKTRLEPSDGEEETKGAEKWVEAFDSEVAEPVTPAELTMNGNAADHEESLSAALAVHTPATLPCESGSEHDGVLGAQLGTKLPTAEPCSDDNLRILENLANNKVVPIVEGHNLNHAFPYLTQQTGNLNVAETSAKEAPQAHTVAEIEPAITGGHYQGQGDTLLDATLSPHLDDTELQARQGSVERSALNCSMIQDATLHFDSKETRTESSAEQVVEEPAQGPSTDATLFPSLSTPDVPLIPNLERPDMSWASDSPVAFTSSFPKPSVDKKIDELRARAEAALLRRHILRQHTAQRKSHFEKEVAAPAPAGPAQENEDTQGVPKSGKMSNRKKQRQAEKAKRQALLESSAATRNPPASSSAVVATAPMGPQHTVETNHNSMNDEFKVETRPSKRSQRARAYAESKQKKAQELKAAQELKKLQEKEAAAQLAAAPVLAAAAKRRNRQKRNQGGKSYADALKL